jgi:NTP pyrophosphatase (non-canonical NTP hydrolase)
VNEITDSEKKGIERLARGIFAAVLPDELRGVVSWIEGFKMIQAQVVKTSIEHGWHEDKRTDGESTALVMSEVSEAFEAMREKLGGDPVRGYNPSIKIGPEFNGVEEEWADVIIRLMDEADRRGLKLAEAVIAKMAFNAKREYRHGGKRV